MLALAAIAVSSSYYNDDVIGPIADLLHRQRGFSQSQLGMLNGVISIPNVALALINGLLIDRYGPARIAFWSAAIGVLGAALTAVGNPYPLMVAGRFIFGISEGAIFIALLAGLAQWFSRSGIALAAAVYLSLARVGSYAVDTSTAWAHPLYERGWQPPLWFGTGIALAGLVAAAVFYWLDRHHRLKWRTAAAAGSAQRLDFKDLLKFDLSYWYILGAARALRGGVLSVPHHLCHRVFPARQGPHPAAGRGCQQLGVLRGNLCHAVLRTAGRPLRTSRADAGFRHAAAALDLRGAGPHFLESLGVHRHDGHQLLAGAGDHLAGHHVDCRAAPLGVGARAHHVDPGARMAASNLAAGWLADKAGAGAQNPGGYDVMLWFFFLLSLTALSSALLLWRRESRATRPRTRSGQRLRIGDDTLGCGFTCLNTYRAAPPLLFG